MTKEELKKRTKIFALRILKLARALPKTDEGRIVAKQIIRSGTAIGANYRAVCRARSTSEFIAKLGVVIEEADETVFNKKGFTLIELLVVIAIIGLLSTLAVVSLNSARIKDRDARRQSDLKQISTAMELYYSQNNAYPAFGACGSAGNIIALDNAAAPIASNLCPAANGIKDTTNTYLQIVPTDPSPTAGAGGHFYRYHTAEADPVGNTTGTLSYCISAVLEGGTAALDNFVCLNGSCYARADGC
ncbi:MAG: four helix bundle protein [Candidatus Falkowbacteria bacterium]|nr:four helix bundle protein [Candidatus Falkowbacteria bacterium]